MWLSGTENISSEWTRVLWATHRAPGNEVKDERAPDMNTPGFKPGTQWSEVECYTFCWMERQICNLHSCVNLGCQHLNTVIIKTYSQMTIG